MKRSHSAMLPACLRSIFRCSQRSGAATTSQQHCSVWLTLAMFEDPTLGGTCRQQCTFVAASAQEPWSAVLWDALRLFSLHALCLGGSGALAKTAVAPLDRIKVCFACGCRS